jgi:hypothetical protein
VAERRIGCCVERFVAGRLFGAGLRRIAHLRLAKRAANWREEQENRKDKYGSSPNGQQFFGRKTHAVRLRHVEECVNASDGANGASDGVRVSKNY